MVEYDLSDVTTILENKKREFIIKKQQGMFIIKYNKGALNTDNISSLGLFRSVITDGKKIICFSPPKSIPYKTFIESNEYSQVIFEEFVEGTMINCFYRNNKWELSTRFSIGGNNYFYENSRMTFYDMFMDALGEVMQHNNREAFFEQLDKQCCYSFVLQHPANRIVIPFNRPRLVLAAVYKLDGWIVIKQELPDLLNKWVDFPKKYKKLNNWEEIRDTFASMNTEYTTMGIIMKEKGGDRSKLRNPNYEMVCKLKGNYTKKQFQYYSLRQKGTLKLFLKYYPENKVLFSTYRKGLHDWTEQLLRNYHKYYVKKTCNWQDIPYPFRPHVSALHQIYIGQLRESNLYVTKQVAINYTNNLQPARLMFSINYPIHKKDKDTIVGVVST